MKDENEQFRDFRRSLDKRMKLFAAGLGKKNASSDPVTLQDEMKLLETCV